MDSSTAIDFLDDLVHNAKPVPLTDQVRLQRDELREAVAAIDAALAPDVRRRAEAEGLLERLEAIVEGAKPVPLTEQVRFDKDDLYEVLDALRGLR